VGEVHVRHYKVKARDKDQARALVCDRGPEVIDLQFSEYSHELGCDTWSVDEESEKEAQRGIQHYMEN
jgi:hypothetical protein